MRPTVSKRGGSTASATNPRLRFRGAPPGVLDPDSRSRLVAVIRQRRLSGSISTRFSDERGLKPVLTCE